MAHVPNDEIRLEGVGGGIRLATHNGSVVAEDFSGDADIKTWNGSFVVKGQPSRLHLVTHNGSIEADCAGADHSEVALPPITDTSRQLSATTPIQS